MSYTVKLSELGQMTQGEQAEVLTELVASAQSKRNGQAAILSARIRVYEQRYEMSSSTLISRLRKGEVKETADIAMWLSLINARDTRASG
jgi:ABC-type molybdate transport system ATPase subunit